MQTLIRGPLPDSGAELEVASVHNVLLRSILAPDRAVQCEGKV